MHLWDSELCFLFTVVVVVVVVVVLLLFTLLLFFTRSIPREDLREIINLLESDVMIR